MALVHERLIEHDAATPVSVLIVDDRPTNRAVIRSVLRPPEFIAAEAAGGLEALEMLARGGFDLVVLDVLMPDLNGLEVLKRIRTTHSESELPVIMVTVRDKSEDMVEALSLGANDYVAKPIDYAVLCARIRTQISRKRAEDGLRDAQSQLEHRITERTAELTEANRALREEVRERRQIESELRTSRATLLDSERRIRTLYDDTPSMFFTLRPDGTVVAANRFGADQLGYQLDELVGKPAALLYESGHAAEMRNHLAACLAAGDSVHRREVRMVRRNGDALWVRESTRVVHDRDGERQILLVCEDITDARKLSELLNYQASHDALTGLVNRRELERRLQELLDATRVDGSEHALCYLDLDQFKIINDNCGHVAGDELLRQLGPLLSTQVRAQDLVARLGGDEFGVLMRDCSLDEAQQVADTLRRTVDTFQFRWQDTRFGIAVSIGVVPINQASDSINGVLIAADNACYAAKDEGRNRIHVYRDNDRELARRYGEMQWVAQINRALDENRFHLIYHPISNTGDTQWAGDHYELLLRMTDDAGRVISPSVFLPAAERYNLAPRLDRWVVSHALGWLAGQPEHLKQLHLCCINLSGLTLGDSEFLPYLIELFQSGPVPPEKICFEVTETAAIANLSNAMAFFNAVRDLGCHFALDDFGSGLSSFAYLKNLPVDYIKIDGMFVRDILNDPIDLAMVRSIHDIARVMGKKTIAEFVESDVIHSRLTEIGVDFVQGAAIGAAQSLQTLAALSEGASSGN